jgi:hypothetical protein
MLKIFKRNKEIIPLLGLVSGGVTIGTSMFIYKLFTNPTFQFNKRRRKEIIIESV